MRTRGIAAVGALTLITLTACGTTGATLTTTADSSATAPSASASTPARSVPTPVTSSPAAPSPAASAATVGSAITIEGNGDDKVTVTLVKFVGDAKSADQYFKPKAGNVLAAAQFKVENTGPTVYQDSPTNGAKAIDSQGQQYSPTYISTTAGKDFGGSIKLAPGKVALGVIAFEVPKGVKIASVQFATASGFGDTGEWSV